MLRAAVAAAVLSALVACFTAAAQQVVTPVTKQGPCPPGYLINGNYCTPTADARPAVPKVGACPAGYWPNGNYCVARTDARPAVPKAGACPAGYSQSGDYCLKRK